MPFAVVIRALLEELAKGTVFRGYLGDGKNVEVLLARNGNGNQIMGVNDGYIIKIMSVYVSPAAKL